MTRLHRLGENQLVERLTTLRRQFDALKSTSQTMGSTNVRLQRVVTGNAADFHVSATYNVINAWQIVFTPNSTTLASTGMVWHMFLQGFNGSGSGTQVTYIELVSVTNNVWTYRFWVIGSSSGSSFSYDVEVIFYAMSQGTISVSQIQ